MIDDDRPILSSPNARERLTNETKDPFKTKAIGVRRRRLRSDPYTGATRFRQMAGGSRQRAAVRVRNRVGNRKAITGELSPTRLGATNPQTIRSVFCVLKAFDAD